MGSPRPAVLAEDLTVSRAQVRHARRPVGGPHRPPDIAAEALGTLSAAGNHALKPRTGSPWP
ncbi:hypothetical protein, partial [Nocardia brasiliensis]|uniref:hypothetical protein n=1 Tax=Nocardia brasiliensis TaxID=37326 RepID=UPI00245701A2